MDRFVIQGEYDDNVEDDSFWSNEDGWVDFDSATIFSKEELDRINLPMGTVCISYLNIDNRIIERKPLTTP
jgi:hypothetical protein